MSALSLWHRLSLLFTGLLLACFGAAAWLQMDLSMRHGQQVEQHLLRRLADHVAAETRAAGAAGLDGPALAGIVHRLRASNPGVELYVLDAAGRIEMRHPDQAPLARDRVDLAPVADFLAGKMAPVLGDDPLSPDGRKVFSAARYPRADGTAYLYVVLQGSAYDLAASAAHRDSAWELVARSIGLVVPLGLVAGLAAFRLVTRPLTELRLEVERLERARRGAAEADDEGRAARRRVQRDEITILRGAFQRLAATNDRQWQRLSRQDQQRRELVANISHDLRTPLASLHGYLETLRLKWAQIEDGERDRYLRTAIEQSERVGRLAQELLELARLELGAVRPNRERFSLAELALDVVQKLALAAAARQHRIVPHVAGELPEVAADIGMIERVLSNLLDNAIRHTPDGGVIRVALAAADGQVQVTIADSGPGLSAALRERMRAPPAEQPALPEGGRLGLAIVRQILQLHGSDLEVDDGAPGAIVRFALAAA